MDNKKRPFTFINMAMSLDGKISTSSHEAVNFSSQQDRKNLHKLRSKADAILIGSNTLKAENPPLQIKDKKLVKRRCESGQKPHPLNVILSSTLDFDFDAKFLKFTETEKLFFTTKKAEKSRVEKLKNYGNIIFSPTEKIIDPEFVSKTLFDMGIDNLLIEGGGSINFSFIEKSLVDEIYLTLCPKIIGGRSSPTIVNGEGFNPENIKNLELVSFEKISEEFFLRYRFII